MKRCDRCKEKILPEDKGTMLKDFIGNKTIDSTYWHWQCFLDWKNEKITEVGLRVYENAINKALPQIEGLIPQLFNNAKATIKSEV